jgi:hypothetical protein
MARWAPWLLKLAARHMRANRDRFLTELRDELTEIDRRVLERSDVVAISAVRRHYRVG